MDKFYEELYENIDKSLDVYSMIKGLAPFSAKNKDCEQLFINTSINCMLEMRDDEEFVDILYSALRYCLKTIYDIENIEERCKEEYKENKKDYDAKVVLLELLDILKGDKDE